MSSDQNLKAGLAAVIGGTVEDVDTLVEAAKIAAAKYTPILREAQKRIEALEGEVVRVRTLVNIEEVRRKNAEARAERLRVALTKAHNDLDISPLTDKEREAVVAEISAIIHGDDKK
jgi:diphthamide biosynthesis methyltransferase